MMAKEGYKPTAGMQSAARRAIKLKEQGKAKGAGTAVGWTRAGQLARGETLSLSTVKRMYSFFSRHEVDKKGKDWGNAENPSNGKIMWLAWGGDAGFSWSRKIVEREKNMKKSIDANEIIEEVKDILEDVVNPIDTIVEIPDDEEITKALRAEVTKEQLGMVIEHLMEAIESMIEVPEEDDSETETEAPEAPESEMPGMSNMPDMEDKMDGQTNLDVEREIGMYKSDNPEEDKWDNEMQKCWTGYRQDGMKDKGGRMVPNCVPVEKAYDTETTEEVKKSVWGGNLDPLDIVKRKFSAESRRRMAESGNAMPDGSFPIGNKNDLMNAIRSWGRGGSDPKVKAHIKRRAKELGCEDMIPENWK
jgi:hypothetical protein